MMDFPRNCAHILLFGLFFSHEIAQRQVFVEPFQSSQVFKTSVVQGATNSSANIIAVASSEKLVKICDATTLAERFTLLGIQNRISSLLFTLDGNSLIGGGVDGQVIIWNTVNGSVTKDFEPQSNSIVGLGIVQENQLLTVGVDGVLKVSNSITGKIVSSLSSLDESVTCQAVHKSGKYCAIGTTSGRVHIYDFAKSTSIKVLNDVQLRITAIAFSPDGHLLAAGVIDGSVMVWEADSWTTVGKIVGNRYPITGLIVDPKNRWLVSAAADSSLNFYTLSNREKILSLAEPNGYYRFVSFVNVEVLCAGTSRGFLRTWRVRDVAPDTLRPTIVVIQPTLSTDNAPAKFYGDDYELQGLAFDDSLVKEVSINGVLSELKDLAMYDTLRLPPGMKAKEFKRIVPLGSDLIHVLEIKAVDWIGNSTVQTVKMQRLPRDQAVEVLSPTNDSETDKTYVRLQFKAWFNITSYSLVVNLVEMVENRTVALKRFGEVITEEIPLVVGYNQVQIIAKNNTGEKFIKTIGVNRKVVGAPPIVYGETSPTARGAGPQRWAVVVGISEYANPGIPLLKYADADAEAFAEFLRTPEGGGFDNEHMHILLNKEATITKVRDALINFLSQAIDIDLVVIYFAGHGLPEPARPSNLYLLTYDSDPNVLGTTAFPMWQIQDVLARYITAKRIVVLSDACHSGGISAAYATRGIGLTKTNLINQYLTDLSRSKEGVVVFTASSSGEASQEYPELQHGVFTYYLMKGLKGEADYNNDYTVTINELMQYVEEQVKRKTRGAQNPTRSQTAYDKNLTIAIIPH